MPNQSFRPQDLVTLPVRSAVEALSLSAQIATAVAHVLQKHGANKAKALPALTVSAVSAVAAARAELEQVLPLLATVPPTVRAADLVEDNAVAALHDWLQSFMRLPSGNATGDAARALFTEIFGDGDLKFLAIKPIKEWAVVEARLQLIKTRHLAPKIEALGGKPLLDHLNTAHADYGVAVGATRVAQPEPTPQMRVKYLALLDAIRIYVVRVSGSIDESDPESVTRGEALLKPLTDWTPAQVTRDAKAPAPPLHVVPPIATEAKAGMAAEASQTAAAGGKEVK